MSRFLLVALGGAIGSVMRYALAMAIQGSAPTGFPWGTCAVNLSGCFLIGLLAPLLAGPAISNEQARLALVVGLLGGFTTFSAFAWETLTLVRSGRWGLATAYVIASNSLGLLAGLGGLGVAMLVRRPIVPG